MEKYGTYRIYKNKKTGEIQRLSEAELKEKDLEKTAELNEDWEELEEDPDDRR